MLIAERLKPILILLFACLALTPRISVAHPVAQGALEIVIFPERVSVTARVSMEEVLVAAAYGGQKNASAPEMVHAHGAYLLAHFRIAADGRPLDGHVAKAPERADGRPAYELEYRSMDGVPSRVVFQQDVLREFEFAPGNPWEASYVVRVRREGGPALEGLLLVSNQPLVVDLNRMMSGLDKARMAKEYVHHGIMHILSGYDHLLFIAALALAVATLWDLVKVISAFTLAHSITLTLSVLNVVRLPENIVEPMIGQALRRLLFWSVPRPRLRRWVAQRDGRNGRFGRGPGDRRVQRRRRDRPSDGRSPNFLRAENDARADVSAIDFNSRTRVAVRFCGDLCGGYVLLGGSVALKIADRVIGKNC
jgi:hypothetical protein